MASKSYLDEKRLRDAKMLQQEFSKSGGSKRPRGQQSRPLPGASRNLQGASASCVQSALSGRPGGMLTPRHEDQPPSYLANILLLQLGTRRIFQQKAAAQPNLNAVPAARADKGMQDWLNGASDDKEQGASVQQAEKAVKPPCADENVIPQTKPKPAMTWAPAHPLGNQTEKTSRQSTQGSMPQTESALPNQSALHTSLSIEAPRQASAPMKGIVAVGGSSATTNNRLPAQLEGRPAIGTADGADAFSGLTVVAKWHLRRQARRNEEAPGKRPDLLVDLSSPPPTPTPPGNFFEKEDVPLSLPLPIVPSQSSHEGSMGPAEDDLLKFSDPNTGNGFGILIPDLHWEAFSGAGTETSVQPMLFPTTGNRVKTLIPLSAGAELRAAAEAPTDNSANAKKSMKAQGSSGCHQKEQSEESTSTSRKAETTPDAAPRPEQCVCITHQPATTFRGLSSSKWANPGYQHRGNFPRNTEMLKHEPTCPARVAWEKKHPLESGTVLTVRPKATELPEKFQFVCPLKPKRLNPYALPFRPFEH